MISPAASGIECETERIRRERAHLDGAAGLDDGHVCVCELVLAQFDVDRPCEAGEKPGRSVLQQEGNAQCGFVAVGQEDRLQPDGSRMT